MHMRMYQGAELLYRNIRTLHLDEATVMSFHLLVSKENALDINYLDHALSCLQNVSDSPLCAGI